MSDAVELRGVLRPATWSRATVDVEIEVVGADGAIRPWHADDIEGFRLDEDAALAYEKWLEELRDLVEHRWCAPLGRAGVVYTTDVLEGEPETLVAVANRQGADAIVVGRTGRSHLTERLVGSYSSQVVHRALVPVIVVPVE
jgi:nucleotide-binding universal stress UspA family protein